MYVAALMDRYEFELSLNYYFFESVGPKGKFLLAGSFKEMDISTPVLPIYNYGYGKVEWDAVTGEPFVTDKATLKNKDMEKIFRTSLYIILIYLKDHPTYTVFTKGSTTARTKVYLDIVKANLTELRKEYLIYGKELSTGAIVIFDPLHPKLVDVYDGILISVKKK